MAWPDSPAIWGELLGGVQDDIGMLARTIARFEPVVMCANRRSANDARERCGPGVEVIDTIPINDCWIRDTGPVFRVDEKGRRDAVGLGFNGWGGKQVARHDSRVAQRVALRTRRPFVAADFVGEGGGIECDGDGTVMATESSLVNANRNPTATKAQVERAVLAAFDADKMIWLPGVAGLDITDGHVDATARFVRPGVVIVQIPPRGRTDPFAEDARQQADILRRSVDAKGRRLRLIEIEGPDSVRSGSAEFLDSYVNFVICNGAVVMPQFGDRTKDRDARRAVAAAFPGRDVVQVDIDRLSEGGGGAHCVTMHEPA
jgi:agmatine deiminase